MISFLTSSFLCQGCLLVSRSHKTSHCLYNKVQTQPAEHILHDPTSHLSCLIFCPFHPVFCSDKLNCVLSTDICKRLLFYPSPFSWFNKHLVPGFCSGAFYRFPLNPSFLLETWPDALYCARTEQTFWTTLTIQHGVTVSHDSYVKCCVNTKVMGCNRNVPRRGLELPKPPVWALG